MLKPTEDVVRAIANLSYTPSFETFVEWIQQSCFSQALKSAHSSGEIAIKLAGGSLELEDLLKHIANTPENIQRFRGLDT